MYILSQNHTQGKTYPHTLGPCPTAPNLCLPRAVLFSFLFRVPVTVLVATVVPGLLICWFLLKQSRFPPM